MGARRSRRTGFQWLGYSAAAMAAMLLGACGGGGGTVSAGGGNDQQQTTGRAALTGTISGDAARMLVWNATSNRSATVDVSAGAFNAGIDPGACAVAALDANNQPIGLLVQNGASVFTIAGDTGLGALTIDPVTGQMTSSATLTAASRGRAEANLADLTALDTDGTTTAGNGVDLSTVLSNGQGDTDGDLVPDLLDNDNNENGKFDTIEGMEICAPELAPGTALPSGTLSGISCTVFDNLKLNATQIFNGDGDSKPFTDQHTLACHLGVPAALVSSIAAVTMDKLPAYADGNVAPAAGGWTFASYPTAGTAWSASGYLLPLASSPSGDPVYSIWVNAAADPKPAFYRFKVEFTSGAVVYFVTKLQFVFHTPPKVTSVTDGTATTTITYPLGASDRGAVGNPIAITGGATTLTLTSDRPLNVAGGVEVNGMDFQAHIFYLDSSGNQMNTTAVITPRVPDTGPYTPAVDLVLPLDIATYLPTTYGGTPVAKYQIDFTSVSPGGDNSADMLFFTR